MANDYTSLFSVRRLWIIFALSMLVMFGTLLYFGGEIYQAAPPIPTAVRSTSGRHDLTRASRSSAGRTCGSRWAAWSRARSGATAAMSRPDWSADWLHREAVALVDALARKDRGAGYGEHRRARAGARARDARASDARKHLRSALRRSSRSRTSARARSPPSPRITPTCFRVAPLPRKPCAGTTLSRSTRRSRPTKRRR